MRGTAAVIATAVMAIGAVLLIVYVRRFEAEISGGDPVPVLVVVKSLPRGQKVTDDGLAVRNIPMAFVDGHSIRAAERERVVGLRTLVPLEAQNVLMWNDLAVSAETHQELSALVTPGFRAVYIRAMATDQGSPLISPGDYVDVIATMSRDAETRAARDTAVVLLQRVLVLASAGKTSPMQSEPDKRPTQAGEQGLTLSLSLQDAQRIALAAERAHFSVALRNPEDQRTIEGIPDVSDTVETTRGAVSQLLPRGGGPVRLKEALERSFAQP